MVLHRTVRDAARGSGLVSKLVRGIDGLKYRIRPAYGLTPRLAGAKQLSIWINNLMKLFPYMVRESKIQIM